VNTTYLFSAARLIATHALPSELRDAGIVPNVRQTAGEMPTLISLFDSGMGVAILPASAVRRSIAPVVTCEIADKIPMSEIAITVRKGNRTPVVNNFRSLALEKLPTFPQKC
jgi:DNA-binding transcriptional LysR family regulator